MTKEQLYGMKLHEIKALTQDLKALRVVSGWIYIFLDNRGNCMEFVPEEDNYTTIDLSAFKDCEDLIPVTPEDLEMIKGDAD